jgi:hypothetical protein
VTRTVWPRKAATNEINYASLDADSTAAASPGRRRDANLAGGIPRQPLGVLPQSQPAALGAAAPPMGAMGPVGGPMQPGLRLPASHRQGSFRSAWGRNSNSQASRACNSRIRNML